MKTKTKRASRGRPRALKRVPAVKERFKGRLAMIIACHYRRIDWETGFYASATSDGMIEIEFTPGEGLLIVTFKNGGGYVLSVNTLVDYIPPSGKRGLTIMASDPGMIDELDNVEVSSNSNMGRAAWDKFDQLIPAVIDALETAIERGGSSADDGDREITGVELFLETNYRV